MKYLCVIILYLGGFINIINAFAQPNSTILIDYEILLHNKTLYQSGNSNVVKEVNKIINEANRIINKVSFYSVTNKKIPSKLSNVDKKDYLSLAPYWWPNPQSKTGLPYIARDGKVNPESRNIGDNQELRDFGLAIRNLSLAFFFTKKDKYVEKAIELLRFFFIKEQYSMNPNFEFSQYIYGKSGSGGNTISVNEFMNVIDGIQILKTSKAWDIQVDKEVRNWFVHFLEWMLKSKKGKINSQATNNIATYYAVQTITIAIFIDELHLAKRLYNSMAFKCIDDQIDKFGNMPQESKRHASVDYIVYNAEAFINLKKLGDYLGIDLWSYKGKSGGSLPLLLNNLVFSNRNLNRNFVPFIRRNTVFLYKTGILKREIPLQGSSVIKNKF